MESLDGGNPMEGKEGDGSLWHLPVPVQRNNFTYLEDGSHH
jgi:hypothetical protein